MRSIVHTTLWHRWLGLLWPANLSFMPALLSRLAAVETSVRELTSLVSSGALPFPLAATMFEAKVDAAIAYGR